MLSLFFKWKEPRHLGGYMRYLLWLTLLAGCATTQSLRMSPTAANNLNFLYERMPTEFAFCVYGSNNGNSIVVERIDLPFIYEATENYVRYQPCKGPGYLGIGHSHMKGGFCAFSDMDAHSLANADADFGFLVCEGDRLLWYRKASVQRQLGVQ